QRRRPGLHRDRDDGEDPAHDARGRPPDQLPLAGRAPGRRRRDHRVVLVGRQPCGDRQRRARLRPDDPGGVMAVETLTSVPTLGAIYAKAALASVPGLPGPRPSSELPERTLRLTGHRVDRNDLLEYERTCGFANTDVLPHTYPHVLGFPLQMLIMTAKDFPLSAMGMVHVENVITVHREIRFDEELDITVAAQHLRAHPKGRVVDLVTEVDVAGERVWEGRSTYLARGRGDAEAERGEQPPS